MPEPEWKQLAFQVRDYVAETAAEIAKLNPPLTAKYPTLEHFVAANGRPFKPGPKPKKGQRGELQLCYKNAHLAMRTDRINLVYVEGYALIGGAPVPQEHAWCVNRRGEVVDVTWYGQLKGVAYWGVPMNFKYVAISMLRNNHYGVLTAEGLASTILTDDPGEWAVPDEFFCSSAKAVSGKASWKGRILSVQPRIRLNRSFDERTHSYLGYVLQIEGTVADEERLFTVALGKSAQAKHAFRGGDEVSGQSVPVDDTRLETAEFYKTSKLKSISRKDEAPGASPPFLGVPPELPTYRRRGHRRLAARTYESKCATCIWGCRMPVMMTIDHWNPSKKRYRFETFCYGPKSCPNYKPGPKRKVPGRKGMVHVEEDWIDEDATAHRGEDE